MKWVDLSSTPPLELYRQQQTELKSLPIFELAVSYDIVTDGAIDN